MRSALALAFVIALGCAPDGHRAPPLHPGDGEAARAIATVVLSRPITVPDNFVMRPDEFAGVTADHERGVVYTGSREGTLLAIEADRGDVRWERDLHGGVGSIPVLAELGAGETVLLVGTDNGILFAIDPDTQKERWRYATDGRVRSAPVVLEGVVYFANSRDQVFALDVKTGDWRWQYEQELQTDFTVYGHAGLTLVPSADPAAPEQGIVLACFDNGKVVALSAGAGESMWIASVAPAGGGNFVDCDATPLADVARGLVFVSGQSTGVHALQLADGTAVWNFPMRGASTVVDAPGGALATASSLEGVFALDRDGGLLWRRQLDPGSLSVPLVVGDTLVLTHSEAGLVALDASTGELLGRLFTGSGMSSTPSWDPIGERIYAITNRGILIGLHLD
ncbi:MAG TPA: PQQ-binding-like beta-propeller repeat protein [Nannocystaceae bacterium]|nr:PQQ-binding-like beta-propeller repeat protein [Nannocystaceae bacterium]